MLAHRIAAPFSMANRLATGSIRADEHISDDDFGGGTQIAAGCFVVGMAFFSAGIAANNQRLLHRALHPK